MVKYIVTGGAGFIGSHLTDRLLRSGNDVVVIDNLSSGKISNLGDYMHNPHIEVKVGSVCENLEGLFGCADAVFHLAAMPQVQYSIEHPAETSRANLEGTLNVLEACRKFNVKRLVYSSSSAVYGNQDNLPLNEKMQPSPMSPYATQKLAGEYYCQLYSRIYGIETIILRYFNVYGKRQNPSGSYASLIPKTIEALLSSKSPKIFGDGNQTRDFVYVDDVVDANILASETKNMEAIGQIINIGGGKNISVNSAVKIISECLGSPIKPVHLAPLTEPRDTLADISLAEKLLGWHQKYDFRQGIAKTVEWFSKSL